MRTSHSRALALLGLLVVLAPACAYVSDTEALPPLPVIDPAGPDPEPTASVAPGAVEAVGDGAITPTEPPASEEPEPATSETAGAAPWVKTIARTDAVTTVREWEDASNRSTCAALALNDIDALGDGWSIRGAFFSGGWGVAFDLPDGPGRNKSGTRCEDCGRGAFGVAGTSDSWDDDELDGADTVVEYSDESIVAIAEQSGPKYWVGRATLPDEDCVYEMWSFVSEDHLRKLLGELRLVSGTT